MKKAKKILVEWNILHKIANSTILSEKEKFTFFDLIRFMTKSERQELATLI